MAIFHCQLKSVNRASGRTAVAAAAYRGRCKLVNEVTGEEHDYRKGLKDHRETWLQVPEDQHQALKDLSPSRLWSLAEKAETRKNATTARELEVALPIQFTNEQQKACLSAFVREQLTSRGMIAQVSIHEGKGENPHAHILMTTRQFDPTRKEFISTKGHKDSLGWDKKEFLLGIREAWAETVNRGLPPDQRIDHRSLKDQGVDREPQIHEGPMIQEMERRGVRTSVRAHNLRVRLIALRQRIEQALQRAVSPKRAVSRDQGFSR